jgi:hypothetical protein
MQGPLMLQQMVHTITNGMSTVKTIIMSDLYSNKKVWSIQLLNIQTALKRLNSLALMQDEKPETAWEEKEDRHHEVKSWQWHLTSWQVISTVIFFDLQL